MYAHYQGSRQGGGPGRLRAAAVARPARRAPGPGGGQAAAVLSLQRVAGNAAVSRLLARRERETGLGGGAAESVRAAMAGPGRPLPGRVAAEMEDRFGADFSGVRVHTGAAAERAARAVSAEAFTTGSHVVFGRGGFDPSSGSGRLVLAHELAHVLQQRAGPVAGTGSDLRLSSPADRFERGADATARAVLAGRPAASGPGYRALESAPHRPPAGRVLQRFKWKGYTYEKLGKLSTSGCGTGMEAELHPGSIDMGESPKVRPYWWKAFTKNKNTNSFARRFLVQGHLLNHKLGGTGKSMKNLTPITKRCNSQHEKQVEKHIKDAVLKKKQVAWYKVEANYTKHPTGKDLMGTRKVAGKKGVLDDLDDFGHMFAHKITAIWRIKGKGKYGPVNLMNKSA